MQDVCHDELYWPLGFDGLLEVGFCWVVFWLQTYGNDYLVFNRLFKIFQLTKVAVKSEQHIRQI